MIKGAIFDIDGTLLDTMGLWETVGDRYLLSRGVSPEPGLGKYLFTMTLEEGAEYMKVHYGLTESADEVFRGIINIAEDFYRYEAELKPGMKELVLELHKDGIPMILATTGNHELAEAALKRVGIFDYFIDLLTATELGTNKREPLIYLKAAENLGTIPSETIVYEDAIHAVRTVKKAGFYLAAVFDSESAEHWDEISSLADEIYEFPKSCKNGGAAI